MPAGAAFRSNIKGKQEIFLSGFKAVAVSRYHFSGFKDSQITSSRAEGGLSFCRPFPVIFLTSGDSFSVGNVNAATVTATSRGSRPSPL
jgi:hypothetical protein